MNPLRILVIPALFLAALTAPAKAQMQMDQTRYIEVTGQGHVEVAPDFARLTLGVTTTGKDASEALAANAKSVNALVALIKAEGVGAKDIQTSDLSISPIMNNPRSGAEEQRRIVGYTVSNTVTLTARDIGKLGALVDKAVDSGANAIYGVACGENDPDALLDAARPKAMEDARRKAEIFAKASGAKIGRLLWLTEDTGAGSMPTPRMYAARMADAAPPTPVEPGQNRLTVSVTARFELTD